jgi:uncharacterized phage-associated protein
MSYLVIATLRNTDLRSKADQITAQYNPVKKDSQYIIPVENMYDAYKIQDQLRIDDKRCRVLKHVWHNVAVKLKEKQ